MRLSAKVYFLGLPKGEEDPIIIMSWGIYKGKGPHAWCCHVIDNMGCGPCV